MSRRELAPEERAAETRAWKADLRSTSEGEREYQEMCARARDAVEHDLTRRSTMDTTALSCGGVMAQESTTNGHGLTARIPPPASEQVRSLRPADLGSLGSADREIVERLLKMPAVDDD